MSGSIRARRVALGFATAMALLAGASSMACAQDDGAKAETPKPEAAKDAKSKGAKAADAPKVVTREFSGTFNGEKMTYVVTAGETFLKNDKGESTASLFTTAYTKKGAADATRRPVTFVFNGGPGSSSLWLHLGVFGPKRVVLPDDASHAGAAPYRLEDNSISILDVTDLVFIDPVGTGYSHAMGETKDEEFWGLTADAKSIGSFMRIWLTQNGRWNSPKYLAGESYGTTRATQLVQEIQTGYDAVTLNGVILVSSILDFHTVFDNPGNDLPYIGYLPSYAAAAWYHNKIEPKPPALAPFLDEVRAFAAGDYAVALLKGSGLIGPERDAIIKRVAHYSGLSEAYVGQTNLRIDPSRFMKQLLRDQGKSLGRYDGRSLGEDYDSAGEGPDADPALYSVDGAFVATINDYMTRVLKVDTDRRYKVLDSQPGSKWKWNDRKGPGSYVNVAPYLGQAMRENPDFRVFVANGYFDLATPFFATELTMANNGIKPERVTQRYFEAGHMMYTHGPSRERLAREVRGFIKGRG